MDKEQAIRLVQNNGKAVQIEAAKRRLINFAKYVNPKLDISPFHFVYYQILDKFAHGQIKKLIVSVPPQSGKALKVDTPVLTTKGWKRHADLAVGDYVFGEDGTPKQVLWNSGAYKHQTQIIRFADGFELTAAPEHEWVIYADHDNHKGREREIIETQNIFRKRNRRNPAIMANAELVTENCELPINPYLLGVWLGDGNSKDKWVCCGEQKFEHYKPYIIEHKPTNTARMVHLRGLETRELRLLGVLENKHIPIQYILADKENRLKLLQGLMDTDGCIDTKGRCEFCQMDGQLAEDVFVLLRTLGYKPTAHKYTAKLYGKDCGIKVRIQFTPNKGDAVFSIPYKQERVNNKTRIDRADKNKFFITEIVNGDEQLVNCIQVEGGIYLAGRQLVPTHNSEGSSRILPSYMLGLNPDLKICIGSYSATIARDFNRDVQRIIDKEEYHDIFPATQLNNKNIVTVASNYLRNSDVFECVGRKGGLRVVGRGGSLTSKTVDISILDDVYKDYAEGNSPVIREAAWKWYTTVVRTRLHNDSQEIIVFTRWHEDDLIGRLEKSGEQIIDVKNWADIENVPKAAWVKINFEAIKTTEPNEIDKRQIGEALWPQRHSLEKLIAQKELDAVQFQCLFQGNPSSAEGRLYSAFKTWTDKAEFGEYIRTGCYIDVADTGKDYLCAICYEVRKSANTIYNEKTHRFEPILFALVTDIVFTQESTEITTISVPEMINRNGVQRCYVEANNGGTQFERTISRKVRAQTIAITQHANKESKILTNSAIVNNQIVMPIGWESRFPTFYESVTTYLRDFKANAHDDAPDAMSEIAIRELADGKIRPYGAETRGVRVR